MNTAVSFMASIALALSYQPELPRGSRGAGTATEPARTARTLPIVDQPASRAHVPPAGGWIEALWQIGPMARQVDDLRTAMALLSGLDGCDPSVVDMGFPDPWEISLGRLRVAWYTDNGIAAASAEVAQVVRAAAYSLEDNAAAVEEARPACLERAYDLEMKLLGADGGDALRGAPPFLSAWLDRLPPYRTDLAGLRACWADWDLYRAQLLGFLRYFDVILCPAYPEAAPVGRPARLQPHHGLQRSRVARRRGALRRDGRRPAHRGADRRAALERRHRAGRGWRSRRTVRRLEGAGPVESASAILPRRGRTPARAKTEWCTRPGAGCRSINARRNAATVNSASSVRPSAQPITRRENASSTTRIPCANGCR